MGIGTGNMQICIFTRAPASEITSFTPRSLWPVPFVGDDPVAFVVSANLRRRHMDENQRAMVAAKLANLPHGGGIYYRSANLHIDGTSRADARIGERRRFGVGVPASQIVVSPQHITHLIVVTYQIARYAGDKARIILRICPDIAYIIARMGRGYRIYYAVDPKPMPRISVGFRNFRGRK